MDVHSITVAQAAHQLPSPMHPVSVSPLPTDYGAEKRNASSLQMLFKRTESLFAPWSSVITPAMRGCLDHDQEGSDLDSLIDPRPETTLFDIGAIRHELLQQQGVPVDVLTPNALPEKFRAQVLAEARPV